MTDLATMERPLTALARAEGDVVVRAHRRGAASVLDRLRQQGSAKALFPRAPDLTAVLLNTAGGITGGDRFSYRAEAAAGADLTLTTQAAERGYKARPGERGQLSVTLRAEAGARLDWLPQETILFEGAALERRIEVDLADDARFLAVEPVIFGRTARGERLSALDLVDQWRVRIAGRLVFADTLRVAGAEALASRAALDGAAAMATMLLVAPDAERVVDDVRAGLGARGGASIVRPGVLVARLVAEDGQVLRRTLMPVLRRASGRPLPKVWRF